MIIVAPSALGSDTHPNCAPRWRHIVSGIPTWNDLNDPDGCAGSTPKGPVQVGGDYREDLDFID
jgi:hypothetical protein